MHYLFTIKKFWKPLLFIGFIQLFGLFVYSQEVVVIGTVSNEQNQRVAGAEIELGQAHVKTNAKGLFFLKAIAFPAQIHIKHSLYKDYFEVVRAPINRRDTLYLDIFLEGKETELEEVTITSSGIIWAYQKKHTHLIDFALINQEMVLVCKENRKYFLRRLDSLGKKIVDVQIKKNPIGLFEDCTGGTHLVYPDSIFEIKFIRNSIGMLSGHAYLQTMQILAPCVISSDHNFIMKRIGAHNKSVEYIKIDWNTKKPQLLYASIDRKEMRSLDDFALENDLEIPLSNPNSKRRNQPITLTANQKWDNQQLYNQLLKKPLYAPVFEINDSIFIFDHFKDSASVFSLSGHYIRSFQISYHYFENWKSELLINEEKTNLYARYEIDGLVTLRQINPSTGKVMNLTVLEKHIHPTALQIRGNDVYYIYKHYLDNSIHYLYKQPLK